MFYVWTNITELNGLHEGSIPVIHEDKQLSFKDLLQQIGYNYTPPLLLTLD